jgi:predicted ribosome quality control (RQC) complex YloA/Tae2 family protein
MAFDYFTLQTLAQELRERLTGKVISRVCSSPEGVSFACDKMGSVCLEVGNKGGLFFQLDGKVGKTDGGDLVAGYLQNARIDSIEVAERDRIIDFRLERVNRAGVATYGRLRVELIPPHYLGVLMRERTGQVLGIWGGRKGGRVVLGREYSPPEGRGRLLPGKDGLELFSRCLEGKRGKIGQMGPGCLVGMDRTSFAEILFRSTVGENERVEELSSTQVKKIWEVTTQLYRQESFTQMIYLWEERGQWRFSALEPTRLGGGNTRLASPSEAILISREWDQDRGRTDSIARRVEGKAKSAKKTLDRRLRALRGDLEEAQKADEWEKKGNALIAQLKEVIPGSLQVELPDVFDIFGKKKLTIELSPERTPAENASWYLKTARKLRRRLEVLPGRLSRCQKMIGELEALMEMGGQENGNEGGLEAIENWLDENGMIQRKGKMNPREQRDLAHPRRYRTSTGWTVWAGRNNRENDILTHRMAAQNDLWFHAHGYPGSHVLLRRDGKKEEPSGKTLEEAAGIAAFWSKGKTAKKVPVVYTLAKYVSKPRGGAPGQAVMRREKTLMVAPALLPEEDSKKVS